jgi:Xaa-Pro aminopeptidase
MTSSDATTYESRQDRLRSQLEQRRLSFLAVTRPADIFYLTGFRGDAGLAVFGPDGARLWVDPRYTLQAQSDARGVRVIEGKKSLLALAGKWLARRGGRVGYDATHLTCAQFETFREAGKSNGRRPLRWEAVASPVAELRAVKDPDEIDRIRRACHLTASVLDEVLRTVRPGVREADLAAELEYRMRKSGAEGPAFETIVASGPQAAWPHARASNKVLAPGELVIFDLGAILGGYAADMTRTVYLGRPTRRVRRMYEAVLEAQREAVETARVGVQAGAVDAAARRVLKRRALDSYFTHSTGHGVGIEVHEPPRLARGQKARLQAGSVVTVEPGVYLEGFGGIRIEDTVLVRTNGPEILTPAAKDCWYLA